MAGCAGEERAPPAPAALADQITVLGIANARFWPDTQGAALAQEAAAALQRERAAADASGYAGRPLPPAYYLAVSGGSDNGPFNARSSGTSARLPPADVRALSN